MSARNVIDGIAGAMLAGACMLTTAVGVGAMAPANAAPVCDMSTEPAGATFCPGASLDASQVIIVRGDA